MSDASPTMRIRALRDLDVDNVRIPEGAVAEIRRELVAALVACGAADDEVEQPAPPADPTMQAGAPADTAGANAAGTPEADEQAASGDNEAQPAAPPAAAVSVGEAPAAEAPPAGRPGKKR